MRPLPRELATAFLFVAFAMLMTWPLALHLERAISDAGDPYFSTWVLDWNFWALTHQPLRLFHANIFHPTPNAFALSEHLLGVALPFFPLFAAGVAPLTIHNLATLLGFAFCGYAACALGRYATGSMAAGIAGGVIYAFVNFRFHHLPHVGYVWSAWLPLCLLALLTFVKQPTKRGAALLIAALVMNGLTSLTWLAFGMAAIGLTAAILNWRRLHLVAACMAAAMIILLPTLLPYRDLPPRRTEEATASAARWRDWLAPGYQSRLYGRFAPGEAIGAERTLFPGFGAYLLALSALFFTRRPRGPAFWAAIAFIAIGALGARGLRGWFHPLLSEWLPPFRAIRMPTRWVMIAYVGLALLAAIGMLPLLRDRGRWTRAIIGTVVAALLLFELRVAPIVWYLVPHDPRPVYSWLREVPIRGAIAELPMIQPFAYEYAWRTTVHHKPLINGVSSMHPPHYEELAEMATAEQIPDAFLDRLEQMRCSLIVVHASRLHNRSAAVRDWLRRNIAAGRITFVRRFDAEAAGDYVFAVRKTEPHAERWRLPEVPDPSGRTPSQTAQAFLDDNPWTYNHITFAKIERIPLGTILGRASLSGFALSPKGVARVEARFANGHHVVPAVMQPRPDVAQQMPWYPGADRSGFTLDVGAPPHGVRGRTDVQIDVIDTTGRATRVATSFFDWYSAPPVRAEWNPESLDTLLQRLGHPEARQRLLDNATTIRAFVNHLETDAGDREFVENALTVLLGRPPDPPLVERYLRQLSRFWSTRARVLDAMVTSPEFARTHLRSGAVWVP